MTPTNFIALILGCVLSSSCSLIGPRTSSGSVTDTQAQLVSTDFVTAMSRLRGYSPRETTVQFINPKTSFARSLHDTMRETGYGIQLVGDEESSANLVTYVSETYETSSGKTIAYEVSIGTVKLGREYEVRGDRVFPIAALSVRGATSDRGNTLDSSIFSQATDNAEELSGRGKSVVIVGERPMADIEGVTDIPSRVVRAETRTKANIVDLGRSNFSTIFEDYGPVRSEVLIFPNDSLYLGTRNKATLASFADQFDPATDLISVIGCSHGATALKHGNELLATGRATRVREELITLSVEPDTILEEGCWAATKYKNLPDRGVIVTLRSKPLLG